MTIPADKILVGMPLYDFKIDFACFSTLLSLQRARLCEHYAFLTGDADVRHARNKIADYFLRSSLEWLFFVDADIGFSLEDWQQLTRDDHPLPVRGVYARKARGEAPAHGLGFCRIHRAHLEAVKYLIPSYLDDDQEQRHDFFGRELKTPKWQSDSGRFWSLLDHADIEVKVFSSPTLIHYGRCGFTVQTVSLPT